MKLQSQKFCMSGALIYLDDTGAFFKNAPIIVILTDKVYVSLARYPVNMGLKFFDELKIIISSESLVVVADDKDRLCFSGERDNDSM